MKAWRVAYLAIALASSNNLIICDDKSVQRYDTMIYVYYQFKNGTTIGYKDGLNIKRNSFDEESKAIRTHFNLMLLDAVTVFSGFEDDPWIQKNVVRPFPKIILATEDFKSKMIYTSPINVESLHHYNRKLCNYRARRQNSVKVRVMKTLKR